jgi:hypothetical protein
LSGSYKINLGSYPPLLLGEPLKRHDRREIFGKKEDDQMGQTPAPPVVVNSSNGMEKIVQAIPALIPIVTAWMQHAETRRKEEQHHRDQMMLQMMKMNQNSGIGDITKIGAAMGQLQQIFQQNSGGGGGEGSDGMEFIPQALDVLKMVLGPGQQTTQPTRQLPSKTGGPSVPPPGGRPPSSVKSKVTPIRKESPADLDIARALSNLDPESAGNEVLDALALMPPDKQQAALTYLSGQYAQLMSGNNRQNDDYEEESEYEDEDERGVQ